MVVVSGRGRARADAQSRSDGHGSVTDRQYRDPQAQPGGFSLVADQGGEYSRAKAAFARRSEWRFCQSSLSRVRVRLTSFMEISSVVRASVVAERPPKGRFMNVAEGSIEECRYFLILASDLG